jgi:Raf kinase inhibitor-like YbhB/YbcL family protein
MKPALESFVALGILLHLLVAAPARAQQGDGTRYASATHVFKPQKVEATDARIARLRAPAGFSVTVFARELKNARVVVVSPNGNVYVSRRDQGDVVLLTDTNGDGRADEPFRIVAHRPGAHGLAIGNGKLYIATVKEIFSGAILSDGSIGPLTMLVGDLPDLGQHPNRTLAFGPDGMLYVSNGSTCNACNEANPEAATLLRVTPDGTSRTIFASGLRNTIGFDWHPITGELWGMDNGIDFLGDEVQPEELNKIERGKQYGWPHIWGGGSEYPQSTPPGDISKKSWKAQSTPMVLGYDAHSAPMQLVFCRGGTFPREYIGDAFVTLRGSWNRAKASGYEIVRVRFVDGQATAVEKFVGGFLTDGGKTHIARPMGLAFAKDGALLMADDANGVVYRIAYTGNAQTTPLVSAPARVMQQQAARGDGVPLAKERDETRTANEMVLTSPSIQKDSPIPTKHSEYFEGVSPALVWQAVKGAKSYAIIVEDPDSKSVTPFVHWVAWNIPATLNGLPEGLSKQPRLTDPDGLLQGKTSRGSIGYLGPRPPVGEPPHHYHFQVLALDAVLDLPFGAERDELLAAAKGHVLAKGVLTGTYQQKARPLK